ncbi:MAG TPA: serine protease [Casimicrobiaceae bacterium]
MTSVTSTRHVEMAAVAPRLVLAVVALVASTIAVGPVAAQSTVHPTATASSTAMPPPAAGMDIPAIIAKVKPSIVAVGTFERLRSPQFEFRGTGFAIGDGTLVATNAHVLPDVVDADDDEAIAILLPESGAGGPVVAQVRTAKRIAVDPASDLALLRIDGAALSPLKLRDSASVREGQFVLMTGYPIGAILGPFPATHRGMISAITPIAIPQANSTALKSAVVRRLATGSFPVFQLDATAYPGNSGSPIYDPATGEVLGIVNMVFVKGTKEAALTEPSGITYAIPADHLAALLKSAAKAK